MKRYSRQREAILHVLGSTTAHPTAEEVYAEVKKLVPEVGLATVYRNLKELQSQGNVISIKVKDCEHFDGDVSPHAHCHCPICGRVRDIMLTREQIETLEGIGGSSFQLLYIKNCCDKN